MKTSMKMKAVLKGKKILKVIKTLTMVVVICVGCIFIFNNDTSHADDSVNPATFHYVEHEKTINPSNFFFVVEDENTIDSAVFDSKEEKEINAAVFDLVNGGK